jgi:lipopolysaccharide/colanic/teichoic acid biosynthesis glycosyltransferase
MSPVIRIMDVLLSFVGIVLLCFALPVVWTLMRLDSKGPLFYKADRVGRNMKIFEMYKFRTMVDMDVPAGECLCKQFDPRVTTFGHFLRRTKLNELPQMINILKGEMSFVGPRPEAPELSRLYPNEMKNILEAVPGLVGPASIEGRNEEECYPFGVDIKQYYIRYLLPKKFILDIAFVKNPTVLNYFLWIFKGIKQTIFGMIGSRQLISNQKQISLLILDLILMILSYLAAYNIVVWYTMGGIEIFHSNRIIPLVIVVRILCNYAYGLYRPILRYLSVKDVGTTIKSVASGSLILLVLATIFEKKSYSFEIAALDLLLSQVFLVSVRCIIIKFNRKYLKNGTGKIRKRVLIYGACDEGDIACRSLVETGTHYEVVGFIDDSPSVYGKTIRGIKIIGNRFDLESIVNIYSINHILISAPKVSQENIEYIMNLCRQMRIECYLMQGNLNIGSMESLLPVIRLEPTNGNVG